MAGKNSEAEAVERVLRGGEGREEGLEGVGRERGLPLLGLNFGLLNGRGSGCGLGGLGWAVVRGEKGLVGSPGPGRHYGEVEGAWGTSWEAVKETKPGERSVAEERK